MKYILIGTLLYIQMGMNPLQAQNDQTKVVLITLDGFRWQELFTGADSLLVDNTTYVNDTTAVKKKYWRKTANERRAALLPFVWSHIAQQGQLLGNRLLDNRVDLTNKKWFSYPGYNELLTGRADDSRITSNDKINNPNTTILEIVNRTKRYKGKVAAFGSWDVFPFIINEERSGVPVNAGFELANGTLTDRELFLNELQPTVPSPWEAVRFDAFTHQYALEEMKKNHPELIYIAYGETDDFAHDGDYEAYLNSAHTTDTFIKNLWEFTQQDAFYKDRTVFIITTDHGRGTEPLATWKGHGDDIRGAGSVWLLAFGKGIAAKGEVTFPGQRYSNQIAPTILKVLNLPIPAEDMPGETLNLKIP